MSLLISELFSLPHVSISPGRQSDLVPENSPHCRDSGDIIRAAFGCILRNRHVVRFPTQENDVVRELTSNL